MREFKARRRRSTHFFSPTNWLVAVLLSRLALPLSELTALDPGLGRPPVIVADLSEVSKDPDCFPGYRTLKLRYGNGVRAYLVSDPQLGTSSISVAIGHGSFDEPSEHPGLAHLLEHAIFEGSELYPDPGSLLRFCTEQGGQRNGSTFGDRTILGVEVAPQAFAEAAARMTDMLRAPLLSAEAIESERAVVHEEFERDADMDVWRQRQLMQLVGAELSPYARFDIGSKESLANVDSPTLKAWHKAHYTTDRMTVVAMGPQTLDTLQETLTSTIGTLKESTSKPARLCRTSFSDEAKHRILHFPSTEGRRTLVMTWEIDCGHSQDLDHQSAELICRVLNQGGPSSLIEALSTRGWITDFEAEVDRIAKAKVHVELRAELTASGSQRYLDVMGLVYQALNTLKTHGLPKAVHQQQIHAPLLLHRFSKSVAGDEPFDSCMQWAYELCDESLETYPRKTLAPISHTPGDFFEVLEHLAPPFCVTTLSWPSDECPFPLDRIEPWMQIPWHIETLTLDTLSNWERASSNDSMIPRPNPFVPDSLQASSHIDRSRWVWPQATLHQKSDRSSFVLLRDTFYGLPQCLLELRLLSPVVDGSPQSAACAGCVRAILERKLLPLRKMAEAAGITLEMEAQPLAWTLRIQGHSGVASEALCSLLRSLRGICWTPEEWAAACSTCRESLEAEHNSLPHKRASLVVSSMLTSPRPAPQQILAALDTLTDETASSWWLRTFDRAYWKLLAYGTLDEQGLTRLGQRIDGILESRPWRPTSHHKPGVRRLQRGQTLRQVVTSSRQGHGVAVALACPLETVRQRALLRILQPWFDSTFSIAMRSEHQVAYAASSFQRDFYGKVGAFVFEVLSHQVPGDQLIAMTHGFVAGLRERLDQLLTRQTFDNHKNAALDLWSRSPDSMSGVFEWCRRCAFDEGGNFELASQIITGMQQLCYEEALQLLADWLQPERSARLEVWTRPEEADRLSEPRVPAEHEAEFEEVEL
jgi:insulysin